MMNLPQSSIKPGGWHSTASVYVTIATTSRRKDTTCNLAILITESPYTSQCEISFILQLQTLI